METLQAIFTRRSIRRYKPGNLSEDQVKTILRAGMQAPTARDTRSNVFIVIDDRQIMCSVINFHPYSAMLSDAAIAIAVCGDKTLDQEIGYLIENASAASQNILLAAHAMELGAVWLGIYPREKRVNGLSRLLNLPDTILPVSLISIGIPSEEKSEINRFDINKTRWNKW